MTENMNNETTMEFVDEKKEGFIKKTCRGTKKFVADHKIISTIVGGVVIAGTVYATYKFGFKPKADDIYEFVDAVEDVEDVI